jgi:hypothetical protein
VLLSAAAAGLLLVAAGTAGLAAGRPAGDRETRAAGHSADRDHERPGGEGGAEGAPPAVPSAPAPGQPGAGALAGTSVPLGRDGLAADLSFGGVVLEPRAVGVTATYPRVSLTGNGARWVAHVELPTYNCLAAAAPADPVAAGCSPALPEYADLTSPALRVTRERDGRLQVTGRFPTYLRSNGGPPDWTGRGYELTVTAAPAGRVPARGRVDAVGELRLGTGRAATAGVSVLRFAG